MLLVLGYSEHRKKNIDNKTANSSIDQTTLNESSADIQSGNEQKAIRSLNTSETTLALTHLCESPNQPSASSLSLASGGVDNHKNHQQNAANVQTSTGSTVKRTSSSSGQQPIGTKSTQNIPLTKIDASETLVDPRLNEQLAETYCKSRVVLDFELPAFAHHSASQKTENKKVKRESVSTTGLEKKSSCPSEIHSEAESCTEVNSAETSMSLEDRIKLLDEMMTKQQQKQTNKPATGSDSMTVTSKSTPSTPVSASGPQSASFRNSKLFDLDEQRLLNSLHSVKAYPLLADRTFETDASGTLATFATASLTFANTACIYDRLKQQSLLVVNPMPPTPVPTPTTPKLVTTPKAAQTPKMPENEQQQVQSPTCTSVQIAEKLGLKIRQTPCFNITPSMDTPPAETCDVLGEAKLKGECAVDTTVANKAATTAPAVTAVTQDNHEVCVKVEGKENKPVAENSTISNKPTQSTVLVDANKIVSKELTLVISLRLIVHLDMTLTKHRRADPCIFFLLIIGLDE